jgi:DNA-directed RNA polymerase specialized sigma24 family protein
MSENLAEYTGLVKKTAILFSDKVGLEKDDLEQELWVSVMKSTSSFDAERSKMTERRFVYSCVANRIKDLQRDYWRRRNAPLDVVYIENQVPGYLEPFISSGGHDETYGVVDDGNFVMPSTVTPIEEQIIFLLTIGYPQTEIAPLLGVEYEFVLKQMRKLRIKFADWAPSPRATCVAA